MPRWSTGLFALACLLATSTACSNPWGEPPAEREPAAGRARGKPAEAPALERNARKGGDPMNDAGDFSPVDIPASELARIAPRPLSEGHPAAEPVGVPDRLPNVVLVMGCTVRKDQLSPYGAPDHVTPFLGQLAREGTLFDDLIAAAPWTRAASTAILTGKHAVAIGMVEPGNRRNDKRLPDEIHTLGERMHDLGYLTIGGSANPNLTAAFGFDQGYDHYQQGLPSAWQSGVSGVEVADAMLGTLEAARQKGNDKPFFIRVMMIDAHAPRHGGPEAYAPYEAEGIPARVAQYRYTVHDFDEGVARLDEGLRKLGHDASDTLFMVVADHGEGMNYPEHHGFGHGQYFGSSAVHVPWIMRGPGVAAGHRVVGVTSQVDVLPTLLGLLGKPAQDADALDGKDWSDLVRGHGGVAVQDEVYSDTWFGGSSRAAVFTPTRQCQLDFGSTSKQRRKGKFVPGCYDRHADPLFTEPIEDEALTVKLQSWRAARTTELEGRHVEDVKVDPELARQLEVLGYVDGDDEESP